MSTTISSDQPCPCCSGENFANCCAPYLEGVQNPTTAVAMMRSRYSAYALQKTDYILETWHSSTRPESAEGMADENVQWVGLQILSTTDGGENDTRGYVEFRARCRVNGEAGGLDESSEFVKEDGKWFYVDGGGIQPVKSNKVGRNDPCPCGSGKKYKKCCGKQ